MQRESGSSGHLLVDVLDRVLDKGIVIDAAVRISVVGVELLGVDARVVVASIETYLLHADTIAYTELSAAPRGGSTPPPAALPASGLALEAAVDPAAEPSPEPAPDPAPPPAAIYAEETREDGPATAPEPAPPPSASPEDVPRTD